LSRLGELTHHTIPGPRVLTFTGILDLIDEVRDQPDIALLPQEITGCRLTVTPGAARLLVVLLQ
jgi:hypothetical protein